MAFLSISRITQNDINEFSLKFWTGQEQSIQFMGISHVNCECSRVYTPGIICLTWSNLAEVSALLSAFYFSLSLTLIIKLFYVTSNKLFRPLEYNSVYKMITRL